MRKILSLLLCAAMCCLLLSSCSEEIIGEDLPGYIEAYPNTERSVMELDFYIITGEETTASAITTVTREINTYLLDKFKTTLDIHFVTEDEYKATALAGVAATGADKADVILVTGYDMFTELYEAKSLIPLNTYYLSKDFGRLKSADMMCSALLEASSVIETLDGVETSMKYVVPNNRVVGSYDYIMVHKEMAKFLNFSCEGTGEDNKVLKMTSDTAPEYLDLVARRDANADALTAAGFNPDELIIHANGKSYLDRFAYTNDGYICVEARTPVVTAEEAHASSFAIVAQEGTAEANDEHYYRCMEVIYELNTNDVLRNLLQYGVRNTHYSVDEHGVVSALDCENPYSMSMIHTGNVFMAYYNTYSGENQWTEELANAAINYQNKYAVVAGAQE